MHYAGACSDTVLYPLTGSAFYKHRAATAYGQADGRHRDDSRCGVYPVAVRTEQEIWYRWTDSAYPGKYGGWDTFHADRKGAGFTGTSPDYLSCGRVCCNLDGEQRNAYPGSAYFHS